MTDTPIVDAAIGAYLQAIDSIRANAGTRRRVIAALRAANPWVPPADEIEAMAQVIATEEGFHPWEQIGTTIALAAYRARPIMRELYNSDGAPR